MTVPCWMFRYEAMGYDDWVPAAVEAAPDPPPGVDEWWAADWASAMCNLDEGHDGKHVFTPQDEIVLVFR